MISSQKQMAEDSSKPKISRNHERHRHVSISMNRNRDELVI
jgi:hypothetical protein